MNEFLAEMPLLDMTDQDRVRDMLGQQTNILNGAFHYVMLDSGYSSMPLAFKAQKLLRETLKNIEQISTISPNPSSSQKDGAV